MAITPDPVGAFTATYKVASDANTEWQRVLLAQQQLAQTAVQQARQNKADDFNQMYKLMAFGQQERENQANSEYRQQQLSQQRDSQGITAFNANTSRMGAETDAKRVSLMQRQSGDPLGLFPDDTALPADTRGGEATFGGVRLNLGGWGQTHATVFGGKDDPNDNGISAFGGSTGEGGREGVAVPENILRQTLGPDRKTWENAQVEVTTRDGRKQMFPVADLGTAEHVWRNNGGPVLDFTPGAAQALGGRVIYDSKGKQQGVSGLDISNVRVLPPGGAPRAQVLPENDVLPSPGNQTDPGMVVDPSMAGGLAESPVNSLDIPGNDAGIYTNPPGLRVSALGDINDQQLPVPGDAAPASSDQALPPEVLNVPSFSSINLPQETRNTLFQLREQQADLVQQAANAKAEAQAMRRALPRATNQAGYRQKIAEQESIAANAAGEAAKARTKFDEGERNLPLLQKRQDALTQLNVLDDVLPPQDRAQIVAEAADPRTGGIADRKINTLNAYSKVRDEYGLKYKSNGYATAEEVARRGAQLSTAEAMDERKAAAQAATYRSLIDANKTKPAGEQKEEKIVATWEADLAKNMAGEAQWNERWDKFKEAMGKDTFKEPQAASVAPAAPAVASSAPAKSQDMLAEADALRAARNAPDPKDNEAWTAAKERVRAALGGREAMVKKLAEGQAGVRNFEDFKNRIQSQLVDLAPEQPESGLPDLSGAGLGGLPPNARNYMDVAAALAQDIWVNEFHRPLKGDIDANAPTVSSAGRSIDEQAKIEALNGKAVK